MTWDCSLVHKDKGDLKTIVGDTPEEAHQKAKAFFDAHPGTYLTILPPRQSSEPLPLALGRGIHRLMQQADFTGWLPFEVLLERMRANDSGGDAA